MNAEIIKAMNRKNKKHPVRDWWKKNDYKILRVIFFPIWGCVWIKDKIINKINAQIVWSEERVNEILSYYVRVNAPGTKKIKNFISLTMVMVGQ